MCCDACVVHVNVRWRAAARRSVYIYINTHNMYIIICIYIYRHIKCIYIYVYMHIIMYVYNHRGNLHSRTGEPVHSLNDFLNVLEF